MSLDASPGSVALLPTDGIKDPQVRNFLDRLVEAWDARNEGDQKFVTSDEASRLATKAVIGALGGNSGMPADVHSNSDLIDNLTDSIIKSLLYQKLSAVIDPLDLAAIKGQADANGAAINSENTTRVTKDLALASAINNIWASIGGSTAVIQDGSLAAATPTSASATKWTQVVAAVTDPNTGLVNSASIKQELNTYANSADSTFNAIYTVRAVVASGGQTVAGGFGLSATSGAGSAQGPSIDFGVLANKFWIGAPASGYNPATEYTSNNQFPFVVVTTPTTINGVTYAPGVYMKKVVIGEASIDTLKIAGEAVTIPRSATGVYTASVSITITETTTFHVLGTWTQGTGRNGEQVSIIIDGSVVTSDQPIEATLGTMGYVVALGAGTHSFAITALNNVGSMKCSLLVLGVKR